MKDSYSKLLRDCRPLVLAAKRRAEELGNQNNGIQAVIDRIDLMLECEELTEKIVKARDEGLIQKASESLPTLRQGSQ